MHIAMFLTYGAGGWESSAARWMVDMLAYVQPVAQHAVHPERLLLRAEDGRFFVWMGERAVAEPVEIEPALAAWVYRQAEVLPLPSPLIWLHVSDLPVAPRPSLAPRG